MTDWVGRHCIVRGRVQGVFFRVSTQKKAQELRMTGWVKNLANGDVEVNAFGPPTRMAEFLEWLKKGPPMAEVNSIEIVEQPADGHRHGATGFQIR